MHYHGSSCFFQGNSEAIRIRSILRSLVSLEDLVGVLSVQFELPHSERGRVIVCWVLRQMFVAQFQQPITVFQKLPDLSFDSLLKIFSIFYRN